MAWCCVRVWRIVIVTHCTLICRYCDRVKFVRLKSLMVWLLASAAPPRGWCTFLCILYLFGDGSFYYVALDTFVCTLCLLLVSFHVGFRRKENNAGVRRAWLTVYVLPRFVCMPRMTAVFGSCWSLKPLRTSDLVVGCGLRALFF